MFKLSKAEGRKQEECFFVPAKAIAGRKVLERFRLLPASILAALGMQLSASPVASQSDPAAAVCPAQLPAAIDAIANRPQFARTRWGILIEPISNPNPLYSREAQSYFIPASNNKLLTSAAALHRLGAQFRIRTSIYRQGRDGLRLVGRGDPSLTVTQLQDLTAQLRKQGINRVDAAIADSGYFPGQSFNSSWEWEDVSADYGAPASSIILNQNAVTFTLAPQTPGQPLQFAWQDPIAGNQWRVENRAVTAAPQAAAALNIAILPQQPVVEIAGQMPADSPATVQSLAVLDPAAYLLAHWQKSLINAGIAVDRVAIANSGQAGEVELAAVESAPLSQLLVELNQNSNNLYAEALLRSLGTTPAPSTNIDAAKQGLTAVKQTLTQLGVDPSSYVQADGSGLSRRNLVSPQALVQTLQVMAQVPEAAIFRASLPVAGTSGTLSRRFRDTPVQGILQAKTGTLTGVVALSGYLSPPNYSPLAFSILVNQTDQPAAAARQAIDEIVLLLARLRRC